MENTQLQETQPLNPHPSEESKQLAEQLVQQETQVEETFVEEVESNTSIVSRPLKLLENPEEMKLYAIGDDIDTTNYNSAVQVIDVLIRSNSLPPSVKSVERAFALLQFGKDYGLTPMQSFHHVVRVGKSYSPDATALAICLRHNKVGTRVVKDCYYLYADGQDFHIDNRWKDNEHFDRSKPITETNMPKLKLQPIDRYTEMEYWYKDEVLGEVVKGSVRYYWSDVPPTKQNQDTYQYYAKDMFIHKCKTKIAKQLGILSYSDALEMKEFYNEPIQKSDFMENA
jgi:hypothetical protein